ncbi:MAG: DUF2846 domain-containing protein [Bacteroidales bacterium]
MKKSFLFSILIVLLSASEIFGQLPGIAQSKATLYFYRQHMFQGSSVKMTILVNGQPVVKLRNGSFFRYEIDPGTYDLSAQFGAKTKLRLSVEPGRTYYVNCFLSMGMWSGIPVLEIVDPTAGQAVIAGNGLKEQAPEQIEVKTPRSAIGLTLGAGFGMERFPLFETTENKKVYLSTGGGFSIGADYSKDVSKMINISGQIFYQGSTLSMSLDNASGSFDRMGITITPSVIIPVRGGEQFRFQFGAGPGLYSYGTAKINASELGGDKMTFKYDPAFGLHVSLIFQARFSEHGAMTLGMRYYNIAYDYKSSANGHSPAEYQLYDLVKPNGSGLDFLMGYYYKF